MMADFETALEVVRQASSAEADLLREEGFRKQDKRMSERAEAKKEELEATSDLLTALIASGVGGSYAMRLQELIDRVDLHQSAVIEALLDNQEQLDEMQDHLDHLLSNAYELPDGRKVFETEDGRQVFDQHGNVLSASEIDPDQIPDHHPSWETWKSANDANDTLHAERRELIDYQNRLDQAQTLIDQGGLSDADFAELDDLMTSDVPDAVRARLPLNDPAHNGSTSLDTGLDGDFDFSGLDVGAPTTAGFRIK